MSGTPLGKIAVLIESHFDETEFRLFNEVFPQQSYEIEYVSYLWGQSELSFKGNDFTSDVTVTTDVGSVSPQHYDGLILIGGYAMDRLRYQEHLRPGAPNQAPAVVFLREAVKVMDAGELKIGTICHSLWLFCAAPELLDGREVTCAHNIVCDVENAGGKTIYNGDLLADTHVFGGLVTARHPGVADQFIEVFLAELDTLSRRAPSPDGRN